MLIGVIGRNWGGQYVRVLSALNIPYWISGRGWEQMPKTDGIIIATPTHTHYELAQQFIASGFPLLIEKPVCRTQLEANALWRQAEKGIVLIAHTRLYSPAWREFKKRVGKVESVVAEMGRTGECKSHLIAMCLDLDFDPNQAQLTVTQEYKPLRFVANGELFDDPMTVPEPLEVLVKEFIDAIDHGKPDIRGLELGVKVMGYL